MSKDIDVSFMHDFEPTKLNVIKRRVPLRHDYLRGKDAETHVTEINQLIYFYRYFETRLAIKKGDVFLARFGFECGNELSGNHYVVALLDSNPINQVVTVVPLKSAKGRPLNPASDIMVGEIENLNNSKEAIAVINQIRTIDKRRLFDAQTIAHLSNYMSSEVIGEYSPPSEGGGEGGHGERRDSIVPRRFRTEHNIPFQEVRGQRTEDRGRDQEGLQ